ANSSQPAGCIGGSTPARTAAAVIAASVALPPACSTFRPAADASGCDVAIIPCVPITTERVACGLAAGRSPGSECEFGDCADGSIMSSSAKARNASNCFIHHVRLKPDTTYGT